MNHKLISLYHYEDFPVFWEVLDDKTTLISSELFDLNVNHEVNQASTSDIVNQIIVEPYSDVITFH